MNIGAVRARPREIAAQFARTRARGKLHFQSHAQVREGFSEAFTRAPEFGGNQLFWSPRGGAIPEAAKKAREQPDTTLIKHRENSVSVKRSGRAKLRAWAGTRTNWQTLYAG